MGLSEGPVSGLDKHRSFEFFSSNAETIETGKHGVDSLRLHAKPWLQTTGNASSEVGDGVQYPLRPSEPDCSYYIKTGCCKFGCYCRFNHPRERRLLQILNNKENDKGSPKQVGQCKILKNKENDKGSPKQVGQCKFYMMPGGCRLGEACRYSYSHGKADSAPVDLNNMGLPVRPGERECPYYSKTGICKYPSTCKFHHPEPTYFVGVHVFGSRNDSSKPYAPAMSFSQWLDFYMGKSNCQDSRTPSSLPKTSSRPPPAINRNALPKPPDASLQQLKAIVNVNSSEPEPQNFAGHEVVKHAAPACHLSPIGLPLRPDRPVCIYHSRFGICKYGPACEFDHPVNGNLDEETSQMPSTMAGRSGEDLKIEGNGVLVLPPAC